MIRIKRDGKFDFFFSLEGSEFGKYTVYIGILCCIGSGLQWNECVRA